MRRSTRQDFEEDFEDEAEPEGGDAPDAKVRWHRVAMAGWAWGPANGGFSVSQAKALKVAEHTHEDATPLEFCTSRAAFQQCGGPGWRVKRSILWPPPTIFTQSELGLVSDTSQL